MDQKRKKENEPELSEISFGELIKIGKKLGYKAIKEAKYGIKEIKTTTPRQNKNRPREVSSKQPPAELQPTRKKPQHVDPRFDRLFGTYDKESFKKDYSFLSDMYTREKSELMKQLKRTSDPKEEKKIKYLINRLDNQEKEHSKVDKRKQKEREEMRTKIEALEKGQKPHFRTKYEKKILNLVDRYDELKKSGKLGKHMKKKEKKFKPS